MKAQRIKTQESNFLVNINDKYFFYAGLEGLQYTRLRVVDKNEWKWACDEWFNGKRYDPCLPSSKNDKERAEILLNKLGKGFSFPRPSDEEWWNKNGNDFVETLKNIAGYESKKYTVIIE